MTAAAAESSLDSRQSACRGPADGGSGAPVHKQVAKDLLSGTSALGLGLIVERGFGFCANLLAARLGGASTFGPYAPALSTANNISSYAAGGIGSTAVRFSGRYSREDPGCGTLSRVLAIIALVSAALASLVLWAGAAPIAHLLGKPSLTGLLHWAALSAAGIVVLECCRGFFVGQRRFPAILLLSLAVGVCVLLYRPLGLAARPLTARPGLVRPLLKEVWSFGLVQLAGLVGMNVAGWWLTTLVARSDTSLVPMGFLAISHQLRNMVALGPGLLTESSLAVMAQGEGKELKTPDQVMAVCTAATTFASLLIAGVGMLLVPRGLTLLYGKTYSGASAATSVALSTAVIHMASSPAAARAPIYLLARVLSAVLILSFLARRGSVPRGLSFIFIGGSTASLALAALAFWRFERPALTAPLTLAMAILSIFALGMIFRLGQRHGWIPSLRFFREVLKSRGPVRPRAVEASTSGGFDA